MLLKRKPKLRNALKTILWVFIVQLILLNVSAAIYAYKFTHFYDGPVPPHSSSNILIKTWKLFVGPTFYKRSIEEEPPFPYQEIQLKTSEDILIDAWYSHADSSKKCVVLFHGISANKSILNNEAAWYRKQGYNVLMVDLRGHGKSEGNHSSFGFKETDEVEKAFEYAQAKGNTRIILNGCSMGAMVVIKAVSEGKVQPAGIIADMPCGSLHDHLKARARVVGFPSEPFALFVTFWLGVENGYNGFNHDVCAYAKNVKCPILVQWGEEDPYVTKEEADCIYKTLGSSRKKLATYPEGGHYSFLTADPVHWEKEVKAFVTSLD